MSFFFRVLYSQADKFNPLLYAQSKTRLFLTDEGRPHNEGQSPPYYSLSYKTVYPDSIPAGPFGYSPIKYNPLRLTNQSTPVSKHRLVHIPYRLNPRGVCTSQDAESAEQQFD